MRKKIWIAFVAPPAIVLFVWIFGEVVMHLWNWLLPSLFGWRQITFWQALGLLILSRILFGGFGKHGPDHGRHWRRRDERWDRMTPEELAKMRQNWRERCGGFGPPTGETKEPA
jgi:hypothetical protein